MMVETNNIQRWFRMALLLSLIFFGACSDTAESVSFRRGLKTTPAAVKLNKYEDQVVIENGIVSLNLSNPEGYIIGLYYDGTQNILNQKNEEFDRGYLDVVWNEAGKPGIFERINGADFSVIEASDTVVEVSFLKTWKASMQGSSVPINIDLRYILRSGDSGFYSYAVFTRPPGLPAVTVYQIRIVYKLDEDRFHYMAISDTRQRKMPTAEDRKTGKVLSYPEAVLLTHATDPQIRGEVDDKYQYSTENKDNSVHGWIAEDDSAPVGFWVITPSNEFRNAGPVKQELTSHVGPTSLSMFTSTHYAGKKVIIAFDEGETYEKVFGPTFVYLNSAPSKTQFKSLWSDAVEQLSNEERKWPYDFIGSKDFIPPSQRGKVSGKLQVKDGGGTAQPAKSSYVGLALPGDAGSWQIESKGYQFWTQTDKDGSFSITNIVPGKYALYAWVPGFIGDYKYSINVGITPGDNINLGSLVYKPPRNGPTLWEIGIPDRSAAEFFVADYYPELVNKLYLKDSKNGFRQYGLWERYTDLYPTKDLIFTVGVSDYHKDWFYAQVTRSTKTSKFMPTTWLIQFQLENIIKGGNYTLQLALASATNSKLEVRFNKPNSNPPDFATERLIGDDNAIARHGIHGLHELYSVGVDSNQLVRGKNTIYLTQSNAKTPFEGIMYDYIRLESPTTKK
ncbi:rhamnogalacturonate lyase-like [Vigna umbellata]|uniref:rhamnogalacturonate lyase-like n=1 Tax=Vigna umbellata TaxID=87088 RepID=UPI001F5EBC7F|nr:rhamnogalacturonate lyase-like [Vigna umbellata]